MTRYHINPDSGKPGRCEAQTPEACKFAVDGMEPPHYPSEQKARAAYEREQEEAQRTFSTFQKKSSGAGSPEEGSSGEGTTTVVLHTFGVGKPKRLRDASGKRWPREWSLTAREAAGYPEHRSREDNEPYSAVEEIAVDGKVIGYIMRREITYGGCSYTTKTVEEMNDAQSLEVFSDDKRLDAVSTLVGRWEREQRGIDAQAEARFLGDRINRSHPQVVSVSDQEKLFIEEREYVGEETYRTVFLVREGRPVAYLKMLEGSLGGQRYAQLCDVETRYSERRKGYAARLSRLLEEHYGVRLGASGAFTELGYRAFVERLEPVAGEAAEEWAPSVEAMNFVLDWDALRPAH